MNDGARYDQRGPLNQMDPRLPMVCILFLPLFMLIFSGGASDLPEGKGKDVVEMPVRIATRFIESRFSGWMNKDGTTFFMK